jgi:dTDP-4-amino-4,6-dideoxygalactose transaminase
MIRRVPLIKPDLPAFDLLEGPLRTILDSGRVTNFGPVSEAFEKEAAALLGTEVAAVSSDTTGLVLLLQALGIPAGARVVVPSFTFVATAQAVLYAGGVPVFAEVGEDLTLAPDDLERLLARHPDVAAVVGVHTYGLPCQVDALQQIVAAAAARASRPIHLVYDAAHAFGSALDGRRVGTFGAGEVFSLSVTKLLVSIEGGLVSSANADLIARIRRMRNYGLDPNYDARWPGLNGKMSELHALVGLLNLKRLEDLVAERQRKARRYLDGIRSRTGFETLPWPEGVTHTFKDLTVLTAGKLRDHRDRVIARLEGHGVETRRYFFPPVHEQTFFRRFADRPLPRTEALARRVITLPFFTSISDAEMDHVVDGLVAAERALA